MPVALLTGFDVWGAHTVNSSWEAVRKTAPALPAGWSLRKRKLPVSWDHGFKTLQNVWTKDVGAVIACGMAPGESVRLERIAINLTATNKLDAEGKAPASEYILPGGPAAYFSRLPIDAIFESLEETGIKTVRSHHCGTFLCNHVFYRIMHRACAEALDVPAGFIHVPKLNPDADIDEDHVARAVILAVETTLATVAPCPKGRDA